MTFYHCTTRAAADAILASGFRDGEGRYLTANLWRGVWLSDMALDPNEGTKGDVLLAVEVAMEGTEADQWEWIEEGKLYREWLVPAAWLNERADVRELADEESDAVVEAGLRVRLGRLGSDT